MPLPIYPDGSATGLLRASEKRKILNKLSERGVYNRPCEMCTQISWVLGDYLVSPAPIARRPDRLVEYSNKDPFYLSAALFCGWCGNTKLFNLNALNPFDVFAPEGEYGD